MRFGPRIAEHTPQSKMCARAASAHVRGASAAAAGADSSAGESSAGSVQIVADGDASDVGPAAPLRCADDRRTLASPLFRNQSQWQARRPARPATCTRCTCVRCVAARGGAGPRRRESVSFGCSVNSSASVSSWGCVSSAGVSEARYRQWQTHEGCAYAVTGCGGIPCHTRPQH